ncbi:MAG: secretin N-terminal domain-containing protein, partial [Opitutae bacterium]
MNTRRILLTTLSFMACSLPAVAQTETPAAAATPPAAAAPAAPAVTVEGSAPVAAPVTRDKDTLSVDFPDEDIKTILRNVADLFELNLVVPDTLVGKTSIKLRDVSWRQIFKVVLSPVGYTYIEEGNIIKIVSNEVMSQEPGSTEVFILNNAKAADIKPTIDGLIDAAKGGKIVVDARSNSLVITERPTQLKRIAGIIEQLDKATDQVMIESKFVEVTDRDIRNIGVNWASLQGMNFGVKGISQDFQRQRGQQENSGGTVNNTTNLGTTKTNTTTTNNISGNTSQTTNTGATALVTTTNTGGTTSNTSQINVGNQLLTNPLTGVTSKVDIGSSGTSTIITDPTSQTNSVSTSPTTQTITGSNINNSVTGALVDGVNNSINNAITSLTGLTNTGGTSRLATAVFSTSDFNIIVSALKT